jgi:tellurite resistance protein TehA-like permease
MFRTVPQHVFSSVRYHKESTKGLSLNLRHLYHTYIIPGLGLINSLSPVILLIPIAPLTTATAGGIICSYAGLSARLQVPVILYSWWLLGAGVFLAFMLYVLYLVRMMARSVVPPAQAPTTVIVIGPLGQAATALLVLGTAVSKGTFAQYSRGTFLTANTQESIFATSVLLAALLQGFSLFWGLFTIIEFVETLYHHKRSTGSWVEQYTLTWWSLVFPIGTL